MSETEERFSGGRESGSPVKSTDGNMPSEATLSPIDLHRDVEMLTDAAKLITPADTASVPATFPTDDEKLPVHHFEVLGSKDDISPPLEQNCWIQPTSWRPSVLRVLPLSGLIALAFAFCQILASYAILAASNGDKSVNWTYQPNVYLAILTAISNKAVAFAAVQGTVVTFWLRALRGTTLAQLHRDWSFSLYAYRAVLAGRHFNLLALACLCATLVAIDGPLLQRASTVHLRVRI